MDRCHALGGRHFVSWAVQSAHFGLLVLGSSSVDCHIDQSTPLFVSAPFKGAVV